MIIKTILPVPSYFSASVKLAEVNHVTTETLRHYDRCGLLKPEFRDKDSGYRYYRWSQCAQLDMIHHLQNLGLSLNEIKRHFQHPQINDIIRSLEEKKQELTAQIHYLESQIRFIERSMDNYLRYTKAPADGSIVLEFIPERCLYVVDTGVNFYDYDRLVYERLLRKLKSDLKKKNLPPFYFCNVGSIWRAEKLAERRFYSSELFVFMEEHVLGAEELCRLPGNLHLCIYCDQFEKEKDYATRLLDSCEERGYEIVGDYLCEVISDLPSLGKKQREMYIRLQVPVSCRAEG